jgi:hypothetical protein
MHPDDPLRVFLLAATGRPFVWGQCDCALWACDWILARRGIDPGAKFRGRYQTSRGCRRLLRRAGGLLTLASREFEARGLMPAQEAMAGDVVCVGAPFGETLGVAVSARRIAMKSERGLLVSAAYPVLRAWRV